MDRNSVIGFILISLLLIAYFIYNREQVASQQEIAQQEQMRQDSLDALRRADSIANLPAVDTSKAVQNQPAAATQDSTATDSINQLDRMQHYGPFANLLQGEEQLFTIENEKIKVSISNKGGQVHSVEVKGYETFDGNPVMLVDGGENRFAYGFLIDKNYIYTDSMFFEVEGQSFSVKKGDTNSISFVAPAGEGRYLRHTYTLSGNSDFIQYSLELKGFDELLNPQNSTFTLDWASYLNHQEREMDKERSNTTIYYQTADNEEVDYISESEDVSNEAVKVPLKWASFKQQFFNAALIAESPVFLSGALTTRTPPTNAYLKYLHAKFYLPFDGSTSANYSMKMYYGPNGYYNLKRLGYDMEEMVPMGGFGLGTINRYLILPVFEFFSRFTSNYGIIILLLAIFIKLILSPLTYKSFLSTAKMRLLKPEMDQIKEKYKDDMQKQQMETMKLYRKTGVSMMGGCLPMLLQMPILIAMYRFFPASINLRQAEFLWAKDLSTYDSIIDLSFHIPFYGDHVSLFTLLMAATSILYARVNASMTPSAGGMQMKMLQYIMPIFLIFIFNSFSAGLTYYYFLYNILSFAQQQVFQRFFINEDKLRAQIEARKKKPMKKSKWQQRLEDMQKLQEQQRKQRGRRK